MPNPELLFIGMDMAAGPDSTAYAWRMPDGQLVPVPHYIPCSWRDKITPEWGPDRAGNMRWHLLWTGWNNGEGHAKVRCQGKAKYCHRDIVERVDGVKLSRFQYVDHLCDRKNCLTYECLEAVPPGVNTQRGPGRHTQFKPAGQLVEESRSCATWQEPLDAL